MQVVHSRRSSSIDGLFGRAPIMAAFDGAYQDLMKTSPLSGRRAVRRGRFASGGCECASCEDRGAFHEGQRCVQAVRRAVSNALLSGGLVPEVAVHASLPVQSALLPSQNASLPVQQPHLPPKSALSSFGANSVVLPDGIPPDFTETTDVPNSLFTSEAAVETSDYHPPSDAYIGFDGQHIGRLRVIGQSQNTYIVAESGRCPSADRSAHCTRTSSVRTIDESGTGQSCPVWGGGATPYTAADH